VRVEDDGLYLHGKLLFRAAESIILQWLTLEDLAQTFFANRSLARVVRRYFEACRPALNEKHFPNHVQAANTRFIVCLASKVPLKQLHVDHFPLISVYDNKQRVFALQWLARSLLSSRQTLQSFRWRSRPALNMPLLHSLSQCRAMTDINLSHIRIDTASGFHEQYKCDTFTKIWLQMTPLPALRSLTLNVAQPQSKDGFFPLGEHDDESIPLFGRISATVANGILFGRSWFASLESLELNHIDIAQATRVSALTGLSKLKLDISSPSQRLCVAYDQMSPVLATLRHLVDVAIAFPVMYDLSSHPSETWYCESVVESVVPETWQLPLVKILTLNATDANGRPLELAIMPKMYAPHLTAVNLRTCHARGVLEIARQAHNLSTLMWKCDSITGLCDINFGLGVKSKEDGQSIFAWHAVLAEFPWPRMLTCRLPVRSAVDMAVLKAIVQRAPLLRKLTVPRLHGNPDVDMMRQLDTLIFDTQLRSLRIFGPNVLTSSSSSPQMRESCLEDGAVSLFAQGSASVYANSNTNEGLLPTKLATSSSARKREGVKGSEHRSPLVRFSTTYVPTNWFASGVRFPFLRKLSLREFDYGHTIPSVVTLDSLLAACPVLETLRIFGKHVIASKARLMHDYALRELYMSNCGLDIEHLECTLTHLPCLRVLRLEMMYEDAIMSSITAAAFGGHLQHLRELSFTTCTSALGERPQVLHVSMQLLMDCLSQLPALTSLTLPGADTGYYDDGFKQAVIEAVHKLGRGIMVYFYAIG